MTSPLTSKPVTSKYSFACAVAVLSLASATSGFAQNSLFASPAPLNVSSIGQAAQFPQAANFQAPTFQAPALAAAGGQAWSQATAQSQALAQAQAPQVVQNPNLGFGLTVPQPPVAPQFVQAPALQGQLGQAQFPQGQAVQQQTLDPNQLAQLTAQILAPLQGQLGAAPQAFVATPNAANVGASAWGANVASVQPTLQLHEPVPPLPAQPIQAPVEAYHTHDKAVILNGGQSHQHAQPAKDHQHSQTEIQANVNFTPHQPHVAPQPHVQPQQHANLSFGGYGEPIINNNRNIINIELPEHFNAPQQRQPVYVTRPYVAPRQVQRVIVQPTQPKTVIRKVYVNKPKKTAHRNTYVSKPRKQKQASACRPMTASDSLNLRFGPGVQHRKFCTVRGGTRLQTCGCWGKWCKVKFWGRDLWASKNFLD